MSYTYTRAQLRARVRSLLDMPSPYPSDDDLNERLASRYDEYHALVAELAPDHLTISTTVATNGSTGTFQVADDLAMTRAVRYEPNGATGPSIPLREAALEEALGLQGASCTRATHYRMVGINGADYQEITLYPTPPAGQTYRIWYITNPTRMSADGDVVEGWSYFAEWIAAAVAVDVKRRAMEDYGPFLARLSELEAKIRGSFQQRTAEPARILDEDAHEMPYVSTDRTVW